MKKLLILPLLLTSLFSEVITISKEEEKILTNDFYFYSMGYTRNVFVTKDCIENNIHIANYLKAINSGLEKGRSAEMYAFGKSVEECEKEFNSKD